MWLPNEFTEETKMRKITFLSLIMIFVIFSLAFAEEDMSKQKACELLGNCGTDMVDSAKKMQVECDSMMKKAEGLMEKGKLIKGQGSIWQDEEMQTEGQALYDQGKQMYDQAKNMHETCALIIAAGEKTEKKYKKSKKKDGETKVPQGDYIPY